MVLMRKFHPCAMHDLINETPGHIVFYSALLRHKIQKGDYFSIHTLLLLNRKLVLVVTKILPSKEKREFWIILLFLHGHLFKLRSVAGHELGQFVDDIAELLVCEDTRK